MSAHKRLAILESRIAKQRAAVELVKDEQMQRAANRLPAQWQAVLDECTEMRPDQYGALYEAAWAAASPEPLEHPAGEAARAWQAQLDQVPEGVPYPRPADPRGFAAYFEIEAARCDGSLGQVVEGLPTELVDLCRRLVALVWRFEAALCRELGGTG